MSLSLCSRPDNGIAGAGAFTGADSDLSASTPARTLRSGGRTPLDDDGLGDDDRALEERPTAVAIPASSNRRSEDSEGPGCLLLGGVGGQ